MNTIVPRNNLAADSSRNPSPAIWADARVLELLENPGKGLYFHDDFSGLPLAPTLTTQIAFGRYKAFANTGCTISGVSTINSVETQGGAAQIALDTDNDSASIAQAYPGYYLSGDKATSGPLFFECCYAQNSLVTNLAGTMIGLAETDLWTLANGVPFNAGDAITNSASFIGFRLAEDGLGVVDTVVSDRATSFTAVESGAATLSAAYTFMKLGFVYDPGAAAADRITFYVNNQKTDTRYTQTDLAATTNLKANALGLIWASVADSAGTAFKGFMKWWRVAQLFPDAG